jgi:hypothetical protein
MAIFQDLVDGFSGKYASVKRFVRKLRGSAEPEARVVIQTLWQTPATHHKRGRLEKQTLPDIVVAAVFSPGLTGRRRQQRAHNLDGSHGKAGCSAR